MSEFDRMKRLDARLKALERPRFGAGGFASDELSYLKWRSVCQNPQQTESPLTKGITISEDIKCWEIANRIAENIILNNKERE